MGSISGLYYTNTEAWSKEQVEALLQQLPPKTQAQLRQTAQPAPLRQRLAGRLLLAQWAGNADMLDELTYSPQGKPQHSQLLPFSISHSHHLALLAWGNLAVDAEYQARKITIAHFNDYLHPAEQKELLQSSTPTQCILGWWTKKEALAKWLGIGLSLPFREICVLEDALHWQGTSFFFQSYSHLLLGYSVHTCSAYMPVSVNPLSYSF